MFLEGRKKHIQREIEIEREGVIIRERRRKWEIESENVRERKIEHTVREEKKT